MLRAVRVRATSLLLSFSCDYHCNQMERRRLCLNWHNSSATQSCTNWTQKYTVITVLMDLVSVTLLASLVKISLPDRPRLVPPGLSLRLLLWGTQLTADQKRSSYPFVATSLCQSHLLPWAASARVTCSNYHSEGTVHGAAWTSKGTGWRRKPVKPNVERRYTEKN